jgi:hypothetical protein
MDTRGTHRSSRSERVAVHGADGTVQGLRRETIQLWTEEGPTVS